MKRRWSLAAILAAALLLAPLSGCISRYADPGPDPARISLHVTGALDPAHVRDEVSIRLGPMPPPFSRVLKEPVWDWGLYIVPDTGPNAALRPLRPTDPKADLSMVTGQALDDRAVFLAPPGKHHLRLLINAYKVHIYFDGWHEVRDYIPVGGGTRDYQVSLDPGQRLDLGSFSATP